MRKPINSLPEAKEEVERLRELGMQAAALSAQVNESVEALERFFYGLMGGAVPTKGKGKKAVSLHVTPPSSLLVQAATRTGNVNMDTSTGKEGPRAPATMIQRVLEITQALERDLARAVTPKDVEREYLLRSWPSPKKGTLYNLISGTMAYLFNQKGALLREGEGEYRLLHQDIQKLVKMPNKKTAPKIKLHAEPQAGAA